MNERAFNQTAQIAEQFDVIKAPSGGAYRTDLARRRSRELKDEGRGARRESGRRQP